MRSPTPNNVQIRDCCGGRDDSRKGLRALFMFGGGATSGFLLGLTCANSIVLSGPWKWFGMILSIVALGFAIGALLIFLCEAIFTTHGLRSSNEIPRDVVCDLHRTSGERGLTTCWANATPPASD